MAIYHFRVGIASRGRGSGAVASAAYRHGAKMKDITTGRTYDYRGKDEVTHTEITLPKDAPDWAKQRYQTFAGDVPEARVEVAKVSLRLWEDLTLYEANSKNSRRDMAQLARKITISLPIELSHEQNVKLARGFMERSFAARGMVADWVIHSADGNPHLHVMLSLRDLGAEGWGNKNRSWNARSLLRGWRMEWANEANFALEQAGFSARIDHRSLKEQGIELEPDTNNPYVAEHAEAAGEVAREKERIARVRRDNADYLRGNPEHILTVVSARATVFTEEDVRSEFKKRLAGVDEAELHDLMGRAFESPELVRVPEEVAGAPVLTTRARLHTERELVLNAVELAGEQLDVDASEGLDLLSDNLRESQRRGAEAMLSADRLTLVTGHAGTGKTFTIAEAAKVWRARGYEVLSGAASGKATQELAGIRGLDAASLAAWESRWARDMLPIQGKFVFFMDEDGMVGGDTWARIQKRISEMGGKLIAVGDPEQLQPVLDSGPLPALQEMIDVTVMDEIIRQKNLYEREATRLLALGGAHTTSALEYYEKAGAIRFVEDDGEAFRQLVEGYFGDGSVKNSKKIALALSNRDVWALNEVLRAEAIRRGELGSAEVDYGEIKRVDRRGLRDVRLELPLLVREGERLIFTAAHRELNIPKSSMGTVTRLHPAWIEVKLDSQDDDADPVRIDTKAFGHFDYAYAATIHKSQGMSKSQLHVLAHKRFNRHLVNVAMTRHEHQLALYVPKTRIKDMSELERLAQNTGYLRIDGSIGATGEIRQSAPALQTSELVDGREDYVQAAGFIDRLVEESFMGDPHLAGVAARVGGLLSAEYVDGDPILAEDPQGYVQDPRRLIDDMMRRSAVFRASDVADGLARITPDPETFMRLFREAMTHPDLVILDEDGARGEGRVYSTRTQIALEMDVMDRGVRLALLEHLPNAAFVHDIHETDLLDAEVKSSGLTLEQEAAFRAAVKRPGLSLVSGGSGSGKTRVASALARVYRAAGVYEVNAIAPTSAGVDRLRRAGEDGAMSIRQFEQRVADGRIELMPRSVILLDEAGLVGAETADRLFALAEARGSKLVAMRDTDQLSPLEASPLFRMLEARVGGHSLGDSLRQVDAARAQMLEDFRQVPEDTDGDAAARGLAALDQAGVFEAGESRVNALDQVADSYVRDAMASKLAVAHSRYDVDALNGLIREKMDLRYPERVVTESPLGSADVLKEAPIGSIAALRPGDVIQLPGGYRGAGLSAGSEGEVLRHDSHGVTLKMMTPDGAERHLSFAVEDQDFRYRFAFANTVHGAKGRGFGSVHVLGSPGMTRQVLHTAMSLHQEELKVVLPVPDDMKLSAVRAIQRKDGQGRGVLDYGFDVSLAAREAQRGRAMEIDEAAIVDGAERMALWVGVEAPTAESAADPVTDENRIGPVDVPAARPLPYGVGGEVAAELIGGQIIESGTAPAGDTREALNEMARHVVESDQWQALQRRLPPEAEARAEELAMERAGPSSSGQSLPTALGLARGAVAAEALGEDALAARFQRGLDLYGARAEEARQSPGIEVLEPELVDALPEPTWSRVSEPVRESPASAEVRKANIDYLRANPDHIMTLMGAERAIFTEEELVQSLRSHLETGREDAQGLADHILSTPEVVQIAQAGPGGQAQHSTGARAAVEADLIRTGVAMAAETLDVDANAHIDLLPGSLEPAQRRAAEAMISPERLTLVTGFPGAGKSYTIGKAADVWCARGYEVIGGAISGSATQKLGADVKVLDVETLATWESRWERGWRPQQVDATGRGRFVFFMDEAGMVGGDTWARVQSRVEALGGKLVAVGDPEQLQPVSESSALLALQDLIGFTVMDEVVRQDNLLEREASKQLARGGDEAISALQFYYKKGDIQFTEDMDGAVAQIRQRYFEDGEPAERIALAYTNRDVWVLNEALRGEAIKRGVLGDQEKTYGEIVRILRDGDREHQIRLPLQLRDGDRVIFTEAHRDLRIPKSSFGTVQAIRDREVDILIDKASKPVTVDLREFSGLDYGYAGTIHKSQGLTVDKVYALGHGYMNYHLVNVMMTRHRKGIELYAPKDRLEDMPALEAAVLRKGYLRLDEAGEAEYPLSAAARVSGISLAESGLGVGRVDLLSDGPATAPVAFEADAHLAGIANRDSGFLKAKFTQGQELIENDPWGYATEPTRVIDDLIARQSTLRASDVAGALTRVTRHPATFLRLFKEAMQRPDLVVLSEEGHGGEGRIYSTRAQVALEMDVVDRGLRLALSDHLPGQAKGQPLPGDAVLSKVIESKSLDDAQADALRAATRGPRLTLVQGGSGSGKTRLAGAIAAAHREAGSDHVFALAPTGTGIGALRAAGEKRALSASYFAALGEQDRLQMSASSVVVIDDATQLDAETASKVINVVEKSGARLVMLGDQDQPGPFAAGPVFRSMAARVGVIGLGDSYRQSNPEMARALAALAAPEQGAAAAAALDQLDQSDVFQAAGTASGALERLAQDYVTDGSDRKIALAWSRGDVDKLNAQIRSELDNALPERADLQAVYAPTGSIVALRPGDRIALSERYEAAGLRPGSIGEVLAHDESGVRIRLQSPGAAAQELVFKGEDEGFKYRFAFASTVHGARGAGYESVHILAAPGMAREVLATGMALHEDKLNVVVPASTERSLSVVRKVLQTDGRANGVMEYGVDPALGMRQAMQGQVLQLTGSSDLPRGVGGEVMGEVTAAAIRDTGTPPALQQRRQLNALVKQATAREGGFFTRRGVSRDVAEKADQIALDRAGPGTDGRALPTAVVLARGAALAELKGEAGLVDQFRRGLDLYAERATIARSGPGIASIEPQIVERMPQAPALAPERQPTRRRAAPIRPVRLPRLGNLNPYSEAAVARHLLNAMLPTKPRGPGFFETFIQAYQEHSPRMANTSDTHITKSRSGDLIVETANPLDSASPARSTSRQEPHLDKFSINRMEERIRKEFLAGAKPEEFDARYERLLGMVETGQIEAQAYTRIRQEQADYLKGKPEIIASPSALYRIDPFQETIVDRSLMGRVEDHVRQAQIIYGKDKTRHAVAQLFRDQYPDMPDHLARGLGETYVTALRIYDDERNYGIHRTPLARPRLGHLARSLASAVTQHIPGNNPVHDRADLRGDIRRLLSDGAQFAPKDAEQITRAAREIARKRHNNDIKKEVIGQVMRENGARGTVSSYYVSRAVNENQNPFSEVLPQLEQKYDAELQVRIEAVKPDDFTPTQADKAIARATAFLPTTYPERGKEAAQAVVRAAAASALPMAEKIREERKELIEDLAKWGALGEAKQKTMLERMYTAFTHKEIEQLADPQSPLPRSIPALPLQPQSFRAGLMELFRSDNTLSWPWAQRHHSLSKDVARGLDRDRGGYEMD
ncbi:AAA family ATPase [uncultured Ruegeria sp.]|uniref:AAA family ATPase n=1 Tax=uncultured Ruegeria sp. TaxID=259304 RepID=UPI002604F3D3|nr:AAA family ATPase [uncultured Ruegeria sp.]